MFTFEIPSLEPDRMGSMVCRILEEEKKNIKTKARNDGQMTDRIEKIITEEAKKLR